MTKPVIAITMGDPCGVGPEVSLLACLNEQVQQSMHPVIVGDMARLIEAEQILDAAGRYPEGVRAPRLKRIDERVDLRLQTTETPGDSADSPAQAGSGVTRDIYVIDLKNVPEGLPWGQVHQVAGQCAFDYLQKAVGLVLSKQVSAIATAPLNKEAWKKAGVPYPGHTEALAALCGSQRYAMMLVNRGLRVVHVNTHVSMRDVIHGLVTKERVLQVIRLTADALASLGLNDARIAVAGLNPHAGEGGLFGDEDLNEIRPAVEAAIAEGLNVIGPLPPDSVFVRAASGEFDVVIAMYHDQGHIAIKMLGMDSGVNCTIGLPVVRTSVDHGTAFDIAGRGVAREESMVAALEVARDFVSGR